MGRSRKLSKETKNSIIEMYSTREFSLNEIAGYFDISVSVTAGVIRNLGIKPKGTSETQQRTEIINEHIMECFDNDKTAFVETIDNARLINSNRIGDSSLKTACYETIQSGCLLIYYDHVNDFLKELNCQLSKSNDANWAMYKKLVGKRMVDLYEKYTEDK